MAERRRILAHFLVSVLLLACAAVARADDAPTVRIKDLPDHLQSVVTVVGRTGYIAEKYEKNGLHAFTLRDDYNGEVIVRAPSANYPVMGTTYRVVGYARQGPGSTMFLDTLPGQFTAVYPLATAAPVAPPLTASPIAAPTPTPVSTGLLWLFALLCLLMFAVALSVALRRWLGRPQPEWGELFVTSGPDRGLTVPLRRRRIALGRGVMEGRDVRLSGSDQTISNCHALLSYQRGELYVTDMSSNGTRVGGEALEPGQKKKINSGDLIHLGTRGTVVIVRLRSAAPASSGLARFLREPSTNADKTLMVPGSTPEDPAWMRSGAEAPGTASQDPAPPALHTETAPDSEAPAHVQDAPPVEAPAHVEDMHPTEDIHPTNERPASAVAVAAPLTETPTPQAAPPREMEAATSREVEATPTREVEADEDEDEEDSIPHTHLSPMVFTFAGHQPRGNQVVDDSGIELAHESDGKITPT